MKKVTAFIFFIATVCGALCYGQDAAQAKEKVLFVYDELNKNSVPYIDYFHKAFKDAGISYDEATATEARSVNPSGYRTVVIYGMVMAFNGKSPVRDWLKTSPALKGNQVSLFVTANRWFLEDLTRDLTGLLKKNEADVIDSVSTATKNLNATEKENLVRSQVERIK